MKKVYEAPEILITKEDGKDVPTYPTYSVLVLSERHCALPEPHDVRNINIITAASARAMALFVRFFIVFLRLQIEL